MLRHAALVLATLGLVACQDEAPVAPSAAPGGGLATSAIDPACPCWDAEALVGALPQASACVDQTASETPFLSLDLFDPGTATQTQAFTRFDPGTEEAGSCRLAVVGTTGLVNEISAGSGLARADYEGCSALLLARGRALAAGC
jgi:hypothetical protein